MKLNLMLVIGILFCSACNTYAATHARMTDTQILKQTAKDYGSVELFSFDGGAPTSRMWHSKSTIMVLQGPKFNITNASLTMFFAPNTAANYVKTDADTICVMADFVRGVDPSWKNGVISISKLELKAGKLPDRESTSLTHNGLKFEITNAAVNNIKTQLLTVTSS